MFKTKIFLISLTDWWTWALGSVVALLTIGAALRRWRTDALVKALKENRELRKANTQLELEAKIRLDDLEDYKEQVDTLQIKIIEQRERRQRLIDDDHST